MSSFAAGAGCVMRSRRFSGKIAEEFNESKHPRHRDGRFREKDGGDTSAATSPGGFVPGVPTLKHHDGERYYAPENRDQYDKIPGGEQWVDTDTGLIEVKPKPRVYVPTPDIQATAANRVADRDKAGLKKYADRNDLSIDDPETMIEFLEQEHGIQSREDGDFEFYDATPDVRKLLKGETVVLSHHTSTGVLDQINRDGLKVGKSASPHLNSQAGVYLTTEYEGSVVDGYLRNAVDAHGGDPVTLQVRVPFDELRSDPDDSDLSVGRRQFVVPSVHREQVVMPDGYESTAEPAPVEPAEFALQTPDATLTRGYAGMREGFNIAKGDARVNGYMYDSNFPGEKSSPKTGELFYIEVPESERGKGVGTKLAADALRLMKSEGADLVVIHPVTEDGKRLNQRLVEIGLLEGPLRTSEKGVEEYRILLRSPKSEVARSESNTIKRGDPAGGFVPADYDHYVKTLKRAADLRIPRKGESPEDIESYKWSDNASREARRKSNFIRDNVVYGSIPVELLSPSKADVADERQDRLEEIGGTDDPVRVLLSGSSGREPGTGPMHFWIDDGNNRVEWAKRNGVDTIPAFVYGDKEDVDRFVKAVDGAGFVEQYPGEDRHAGNRPMIPASERTPVPSGVAKTSSGGRIYYHSTSTEDAKQLESEGIDSSELNKRDSGFFGPGFYASAEPQSLYGKSLVAVELKPQAKVLDVGALIPKSPEPWQGDFEASLRRRILKHRPDMPKEKLDAIVGYVTPGSPTFSHLEYKQEVGGYARAEGFDAASFAGGQETVILNPDAVERISHVGGLQSAKKHREQHVAESFDESKHRRDEDGKFTEKSAQGDSKRPAAQTETAEFKEWFGGSKIVDEDGSPLVVYHGGRVFDEFKANSLGAFWATGSEDTASGYAEQYEEGARQIMPLYLRMENPLDLTKPDVFEKWLGRPMKKSPFAGTQAEEINGNYLDIGKIKEAGYDGVIHFDTNVDNTSAFAPSYVFFDPNQAKLAPADAEAWWDIPVRQGGNRGTWSRTSNNINETSSTFDESKVRRDDIGRFAEKNGGASKPVPSYVKNTIDTSDDKWEGESLGHAAWVERGKLHAFHVTDDSSKILDALKSGGDIGSHGGDVGRELGPGLYVSANPEFWRNRSTDKWDFLNHLDNDQEGRLLDYLSGEIDRMESDRYITKNEAGTARRDISAVRDGTYMNLDPLVIMSGQPYNIKFSKPEFLETLGIEPSDQPEEVPVELKGKFAKLDRHLSSDEADELRAAGFDGAFTQGGMSTNPELVVWNNDAVVRFGDYRQGIERKESWYDREVYHGASSPISGYEPNERGLIWFARDKDYTQNYGDSLNVARVEARNPLDLTSFSADESVSAEDWKAALEDAGVDTTGLKFVNDHEPLQHVSQNRSPDEFLKAVKDAGYDSIIINEYYEGGGESESIAVFSREQVKDDKREKPFEHIAPTNNPKFWAWFGDSKVVDEEGEPLVVVHGTNAEYFDSFHLSNRDIGIHFGTEEQALSRLESNRKEHESLGSRVEDESLVPVYLSIKNPAYLKNDITGQQRPADLITELYQQGVLSIEQRRSLLQYGVIDIASRIAPVAAKIRDGLDYGDFEIEYDVEQRKTDIGITQYQITATLHDASGKQLLLPYTSGYSESLTVDQLKENAIRSVVRAYANEFTNGETYRRIEDELKKNGYDGLVYPNAVEGEGLSYAVFDSSQAKSINNGNFDPNSKKITESLAGNTNVTNVAIESEDCGANAKGGGGFRKGNTCAKGDKTDTPEFKEWFGRSKIVNSDGSPQIIFSGQPQGVTEFSGSERSEFPFGVGFFTTGREVAAKYAGSHPDERGSNRQVTPDEYGIDIDLSPKHERMLWDAAGGEDAFNDLSVGEHVELVSRVIPSSQLPATEREGKSTDYSLGKRGRTYRVYARIEKPLDGDYFNDAEWRDVLGITGSEDEQIESIAELTGITPVFDDDDEQVIGWETKNGNPVDDPNDLEDIVRAMWGDRDGGGDFLQYAINNSPNAIATVLFPDAAMELVEKYGYDGLVFRDEEMGGTTIIPFHANQVKSARTNSGRFSRDSDDIYESCERDKQGRFDFGNDCAKDGIQENKVRLASLINAPQSRDEANALAWAARENVIGDSRAENGDCTGAAIAIASLRPDAEIWSGEFLGDGVDRDLGGHHVIAKVGDYFIDITHDQFSGQGDDPVVVMDASELEQEGYGAFRRSKGLESQIQFQHSGIVKDLANYEHSDGMLQEKPSMKPRRAKVEIKELNPRRGNDEPPKFEFTVLGNVIRGQAGDFPLTATGPSVIEKLSKKTIAALEDAISDPEIVADMFAGGISEIEVDIAANARKYGAPKNWTASHSHGKLTIHTKTAEAIAKSTIAERKEYGLKRVFAHEAGHGIWDLSGDASNQRKFIRAIQDHPEVGEMVGKIVSVAAIPQAFSNTGSRLFTESFAELSAMRRYDRSRYDALPEAVREPLEIMHENAHKRAKRFAETHPNGLVKRPAMEQFCPTGKGGGVDPTCSPGKKADLPDSQEDYLKFLLGEGPAPEATTKKVVKQDSKLQQEAISAAEKFTSRDNVFGMEPTVRKRRLDEFGDLVAEMKGEVSSSSRRTISTALLDAAKFVPNQMLGLATSGLKYVAHESYQKLNESLGSKLPHGFVASGGYDPGSRKIHVTPLSVDMGIGTALHELGHAYSAAIAGHQIGNSRGWKKVWSEEINTDETPLSEYAKKNSEEGFAEWFRSFTTNPVETARVLPRSTLMILNREHVR